LVDESGKKISSMINDSSGKMIATRPIMEKLCTNFPAFKERKIFFSRRPIKHLETYFIDCLD
jgi:hypothetical protein